jgi:hypothetical protein
MVATVEVVGGGTVDVEAVGGGGGGSVVGGGGGSVVAGLVAGGGEVAGGDVTTWRGAVVTTWGWVDPVPPGMVEVDPTVDEVDDVGPPDVVAGAASTLVVVVARAVVDGDWVATCCLGDVSLPVATSNSSAARAIDARA